MIWCFCFEMPFTAIFSEISHKNVHSQCEMRLAKDRSMHQLTEFHNICSGALYLHMRFYFLNCEHSICRKSFCEFTIQRSRHHCNALCWNLKSSAWAIDPGQRLKQSFNFIPWYKHFRRNGSNSAQNYKVTNLGISDLNSSHGFIGLWNQKL